MMDLFDLSGKKAMVTGASRGLGLAMAQGLLEAGAQVALIASSREVCAVSDALALRGFRTHAVRGDLSCEQGLCAAFDQALAALGGQVDILVNCAGIQRRHNAEDFPLEDWNAVLAVNLTATFRLCQRAGRHMLARGGGKIINIASMLSFFGGYTVPAYAASKGGVAQLTKALANEWAGRGVHVNAIAPGYMDTDMNAALIRDPVRNREILSRIPAGRWGSPQDMKGVCVFLASRASDYLDGAVIPVDGGYLGR